MGGDVIITESELGKGSSFEIAVMARAAEGPVQKSPPTDRAEKIDLSDVSVLLVDDSRDNRRLVSHLLQRSGASVEVATDGREALAKAMSSGYDVILMDVQMPGMDGCEATTQLRKQGLDRPIIALTAHAMAEEKKRFLSAGYTDHLAKPIDVKKLLETVRHYASVPTLPITS
jgi:CheY-like chemotaxis protein